MFLKIKKMISWLKNNFSKKKRRLWVQIKSKAELLYLKKFLEPITKRQILFPKLSKSQNNQNFSFYPSWETLSFLIMLIRKMKKLLLVQWKKSIANKVKLLSMKEKLQIAFILLSQDNIIATKISTGLKLI